MSYTEIHQRRGMPYGGLPEAAILQKFEETPPPAGAPADIEDEYDRYARGELVDRAPDATFLESDHARRDPATSRTLLNLRHSGGRGANDHRLPRHPEMFIGFTGDDPRGADNQPRLENSRAQITARGYGKQVRMGRNVGHSDYIEADRPWGGDAFEYGKKEAQKRMKSNLLWFPGEKEGRPWGRNMVADEFYGLRQKTAAVGGGGESLGPPTEPTPAEVYTQLSHQPAQGAESGPRKRRETFTPGGGRSAAQASGAFGRNGAGTNPKAASAFMSALASHRRARNQRAVQESRGDGLVGDGVGGWGGGAGLAPAANPLAATHSAGAAHAESANSRLAGVGAMVRTLREGQDRRQAQGGGLTSGHLGGHLPPAYDVGGGGLAPARDPRATAGYTTAALAASGGAAAEKAAAPYGRVAHANLSQPFDAVHSARVGGFVSAKGMAPGRREGAAKAPEFTSHTYAPTVIGGEASETFGAVGADSVAIASGGGGGVANNSLRPLSLPDAGDDVLSENVFN